MLFPRGTRDPFATPELLHATVAALPAATLVEIDGGDHSFKVRGRSPADVTSQLVEVIDSFLSR
jgi:predicted alpha/beta-hydrolase family hydrolase